MINKLVASAKSQRDKFMSSLMSFIYKRNRSGPKREPCRTSALTKCQETLAPGKQLFVSCHLVSQRTNSITVQIHLQILV